jgi:hypothetical protein
MGRKIQFYSLLTDLSLEISHVDCHFSFVRNWFSRLKSVITFGIREFSSMVEDIL